MNPTFNLIDEPWIPCARLDSIPVELSLRDTLAKAHELKGIQGESPLVTAALYRLLLAVLHSVLRGPENSSEWAGLWKTRAWDMAKIGGYLDHWYNRFYLFNTERPFYQSADERMKPKSIISLIPDMASGNNSVLFDHHTEEVGAILTPAQAGRAIVAAQAFGLAGLCNPKFKLNFTDGPCARGITFIIEGRSLFKTLMLNMIRYTEDEPLAIRARDLPTWEMDDPYKPLREIPLGYLDYLTWQNRRVMLIPESSSGSIVVMRMKISPGLRLDPNILDPFKHYRKDKKRGELVWRFSEGRVLWRDSSALFELNAPDKYRPPQNFAWIAYLVRNHYLDPSRMYSYMALGMANDQAKVEFFREEHLPLPLTYFEESLNVEKLSTALEYTEKARNYLWGAVNTFATLLISPSAYDNDGRKPDPKDVKRLTDHWGVERNYWGGLELPFLILVEHIPKEPQAALADWQIILKRTTWHAFRQAERLAGTSPASLKAGVRASGQLAGGLEKLFPQT